MYAAVYGGVIAGVSSTIRRRMGVEAPRIEGMIGDDSFRLVRSN